MNEKFIFTCSTNDQDVLCRFLSNIQRSESEKVLNASVVIDRITYQPSLISEEIDVIIRLIQTQWCNIQTIALYDDVIPYNEILSSREVLSDYMNLIKTSLHETNYTEQRKRYLEEMFDVPQHISKFIVPFSELEPDIILKVAAVNTNNNKCPIYQYFHTNLEIHYNLLVLYHLSENSLQLADHIEKVTQDLIAVCRQHFKRLKRDGEMFMCPCIRQLFMILQLIKQKTGENENSFWKMFNGLLENDDPLFSFSLLKCIVAGQQTMEMYNISNISTNFDFLETKLKFFLTDPVPNIIPGIFKIIDFLVNDIWSKNAKIELFQIIWDYYSKRLNISNKDYTKLNSLDLYTNMETILIKRENCKEDFELFVAILVAHLKNHPEHWGKMKGRIYSQLGTNKLKELNPTGIAHVSILFIALSNIFYEEMQKKILSLLEVFVRERKEQPMVWNIFAALVFHDVSGSKDLEKTAMAMRPMFQNACSESKFFYFIRIFLSDFKYTLTLNQNMSLHQWMFFDTWLDKYLSTCSIQDLKAALELFWLILQTLSKTDSWIYWQSVFKDCIYPPLKKIATSFNAPEEIGKIAGTISVLDLELSDQIFNTFTSEVSPKVSNQFLLIILDDYRNKFVLSEQQKSLFVQSWIKICLLTGDSSEQLTNRFLQLDIFPPSLKSYIGNAQNPLYALLEYLGSDIKTHLQSDNIHKICENSFGHIDKWLSQYLNQIEDEQILYRIFTFISLAFLHCGRLLYNRNKISTPFTKLVEVVLLPQSVLLGYSPHKSIINAVKQTWHLFFEALINLNSDNDKYLERTLRDMITKYVPFFTTADSPFMKCLENEKSFTVLLEKISTSYFKHPVKEPDANILKVLKILKNIIESTTSLTLIKAIIEKTLHNIFEFIILHPQRNAAFVVVKTITISPLYPQIRNEFCNTVLAISEKHLAHNTINYFQLLCILGKFVPGDMKNLLGVIKQQVSNVERLRGVGFDKNLRMQYEKFERSINECI